MFEKRNPTLFCNWVTVFGLVLWGHQVASDIVPNEASFPTTPTPTVTQTAQTSITSPSAEEHTNATNDVISGWTFISCPDLNDKLDRNVCQIHSVTQTESLGYHRDVEGVCFQNSSCLDSFNLELDKVCHEFADNAAAGLYDADFKNCTNYFIQNYLHDSSSFPPSDFCQSQVEVVKAESCKLPVQPCDVYYDWEAISNCTSHVDNDGTLLQNGMLICFDFTGETPECSFRNTSNPIGGWRKRCRENGFDECRYTPEQSMSRSSTLNSTTREMKPTSAQEESTDQHSITQEPTGKPSMQPTQKTEVPSTMRPSAPPSALLRSPTATPAPSDGFTSSSESPTIIVASSLAENSVPTTPTTEADPVRSTQLSKLNLTLLRVLGVLGGSLLIVAIIFLTKNRLRRTFGPKKYTQSTPIRKATETERQSNREERQRRSSRLSEYRLNLASLPPDQFELRPLPGIPPENQVDQLGTTKYTNFTHRLNTFEGIFAAKPNLPRSLSLPPSLSPSPSSSTLNLVLEEGIYSDDYGVGENDSFPSSPGALSLPIDMNTDCYLPLDKVEVDSPTDSVYEYESVFPPELQPIVKNATTIKFAEKQTQLGSQFFHTVLGGEGVQQQQQQQQQRLVQQHVYEYQDTVAARLPQQQLKLQPLSQHHPQPLQLRPLSQLSYEYQDAVAVRLPQQQGPRPATWPQFPRQQQHQQTSNDIRASKSTQPSAFENRRRSSATYEDEIESSYVLQRPVSGISNTSSTLSFGITFGIDGSGFADDEDV